MAEINQAVEQGNPPDKTDTENQESLNAADTSQASQDQASQDQASNAPETTASTPEQVQTPADTGTDDKEQGKAKRGRKPKGEKEAAASADNPKPATPAAPVVSAKTAPEKITIVVTNKGKDFYESQSGLTLKRDVQNTIECANALQKQVILSNFKQLNELARYARFVVGE